MRWWILPLAGAAFAMMLATGASADSSLSAAVRQNGDIETQWRQLVSENMGLTDDERAAFDPLYRDYRDEVVKINKEVVDLLVAYANSYDNLDDAKALQLLHDYLDQKAERLRLDEAYMPRFEKIMAPKKVVRLFQIENKLRTEVSAYFAERVPLIDTGTGGAAKATEGAAPPSGSSDTSSGAERR